MFDTKEHSHRRLNILTGEWIQVSPHRSKRPWQGQIEKVDKVIRPSHDPTCYLCPGTKRADGSKNPAYEKTFVFTNDFSALQQDISNGTYEEGLLQAHSEKGICRVICFSPRHHITIAEMQISEIRQVVDTWIDQCHELSAHDFINYIQIFENKGSVMGCSNPHPHGQIWSQESIPGEPMKKQIQQEKYYHKYEKTLLSTYLNQEQKSKVRLIYENEHMVVLVPFWAVWPFETMIIPKRPMAQIVEMNSMECDALADAYRHLTIKYDNLFKTSFPYSAGIHQAPFDGQSHKAWHWHMVFYPPLLRSASVKKFMVGYEMLASPQRDITAEFAAKQLRILPDVHYASSL